MPEEAEDVQKNRFLSENIQILLKKFLFECLEIH